MKIFNKKLLSLLIGGFIYSGFAHADIVAEGTAINDVPNGSSATGWASIAMGFSNTASNTGAVAMGYETQALAVTSTAMGYSTVASDLSATAMGALTVASGERSTAMGLSSQATGDNSTAMGYQSRAMGDNSTAMGSRSQARGVNSLATQGGFSYTENSIALGHQTIAGRSGGSERALAVGQALEAVSNNSLALGYDSSVSGENSITIGVNNSVANANTQVLGNSVVTSQDNSVILGNGSTDRAATTESLNTIDGVTISGFAGQGASTNGVVSVGGSGAERQVINVAAGNVSAVSTDAINGSQLHALQTVTANAVNSTINLLGGNAAITSGSNLTMTNVGGTGMNTVNEAINTNRLAVSAIGSGVNNNASNIATVATKASANTSAISVNTNNIIKNTNEIAVNRSEINNMSTTIANHSNSINANAASISENRSVTASNRKGINTNSNRIDALEVLMNEQSNTIKDINKNYKAAVASSTAIGLLSGHGNRSRGGFGIGIAGHQGESSLALGIHHVAKSGKYALNSAFALDSQKNSTYGGSVLFSW